MVCKRRMLMLVFAGLLVASISGCIANVTGPSAWVSNTRLDVSDLKVGEHVITGKATSWVVLFGLVVWGDSGFEAALQDAKQKAEIRINDQAASFIKCTLCPFDHHPGLLWEFAFPVSS